MPSSIAPRAVSCPVWCSGLARLALLLALLYCWPAGADVGSGVAAYRRGDYAAAFAEFSAAAQADDAFAQNVLGTMYAQGLGVERNDKLAVDWFFRAQALGSPEAAANLATMYEHGQGLPQDDVEALRYYREAAQAGNRAAIARMAEIYDRGELGVAPSLAAALGWRARLQAAAAPQRSGQARATRVRPDRQAPAAGDEMRRLEQALWANLDRYERRQRKMFVAATDTAPPLADYLRDLRRQLKERLEPIYAPAKLPPDGVVVSVSIAPDGSLSEVELSQGHLSAAARRGLLSSLQNGPRLAAFPGGLGNRVDLLVVSARLPIE